MKITRRGLLGAAAGAGAFLRAGGALPVASADEGGGGGVPSGAPVTTTICPYCAVGCGMLVESGPGPDGRRIVKRIEGDPEHPINEGALCPKGASLAQAVAGEARLRRVLHRAPGATRFVERDWDFAVREIARRIKTTRDATFEERNAKGETVRRTLAIASVGSAALDNEECWHLQAFLRTLGIVRIEHQARL